jgi:hypothetical protein
LFPVTSLGTRHLVLVRSVEVDVAFNVSSCRLNQIFMPYTLFGRARTHSEPTPAVMHNFSFLALAKRSAVRYAGWKGVVIRTSV